MINNTSSYKAPVVEVVEEVKVEFNVNNYNAFYSAQHIEENEEHMVEEIQYTQNHFTPVEPII